jgi:hypothetical protein
MAGSSGNKERETLLDDARLRWIETWAQGWRRSLQARYGDKTYYAELPLDVAVGMIEELAFALRRIADTTMESGPEIGEAVEALRG